MDLLQLQDSSAFLFDCKNLLDQSYTASDSGYYSASSSLSPTSSTDSCCFSPPTFHCGNGQENFPENVLGSFLPGSTSEEEERKAAKPAKRTGRPRSKCPGTKRQSASEREKLRMRDLTKALHHLRSFLPPSVAPAGQTLTKIETLRLTIHYISHLSAQLETSQAEVGHGSLPRFPEPMEVPSPPAQMVFQPENFNQVIPPAQSFSTQEFLNISSYQNADCSLPASPAQDYWFPQQQQQQQQQEQQQQQYCYYGQC